MPNYPSSVASFGRVTRRTKFSVGWATSLQEEYAAMQSDYANSRGSFSTLASFLAVERATTGTFVGYGVYHSNFIISTAQHHPKLHATAHIDGTDNIPLASATQRGLMSSTLAGKLASCAASATKNEIAKGSYTGSGGGGRTVTLGFPARSVRLIRDTASNTTYAQFSWYWKQSVSCPVAESATHVGVSCVKDIQAATDGFAVTDAANESGKPYKYIAMG